MATPSLAMIPSGKKEGVLYSVLPNTSVGDFTVERGSNATFVNSDGLIQSTNVIGGEKVLNGNFSEEGSEEIRNGGFSTDSDWVIVNNVGATTNISGGTLNVVTDGAFTQSDQSNVFILGKNYILTYTIISKSGVGELSIVKGSASLVVPSTVGTHSVYFESDGTAFAFKRGGGAIDVSIDNVSVKEVGQNWDLGTGWSIGEGNGVYEDSLGTGHITSSSLSITSGKTYELKFEIISGIARAAFTNEVNQSLFKPNGSSANNYGVGEHSFYLSAEKSASALRIFAYNVIGGQDFTITNISIVEVIEATNTPRFDYTDGGCPVLLTETTENK